MGLLVDGEWHDEWYDTKKSKGHFVRSQSQFEIGSPKMANPAYLAKAVLPRPLAVITYMSHWHALGLIEP